MSVRVLPYGDRGLLLEVADTAAVLACVDALRAGGGRLEELVEDLVPGARTVLLVARSGIDPERLRSLVPALLSGAGLGAEPGPPPGPAPPEVEIPVRYDGADLAEVAALTGLDEAGVVAAHTGAAWRVAFGGFAPGFAYLVGGDPRLRVPRRATPRTAVPAGSVGLAGEFSGVYPRSSPGGWQLIGRTDLTLWDADREPPALLLPGAVVRFREAGR
ncbi:allophanate hydrolase subunit 1 [Nocardioides sp. YIM 152588]|uniref:5-oxoprolinase subunit B family protein n=1 Tax=Nocardioides sp. YIM 152588 TaxID=3158259 RepID=UPI0032E393D9